MFSGRSLALRRGGSPRQKPFDSYMKHFTSRILFCVLILSCATVSLFAQRQTPGRSSIELYGSAIHGYGGGIALSNYGFNGRTVLGLDVFQRELGILVPANEGSDEMFFRKPSYEAMFTGGYLWRVLSNRSRSIILSAGICVGLGVRYCSEMSYFRDNYDGFGDVATVGFVCAFYPDVQVEFFPAQNMCGFVSFRPRLYAWDHLGAPYTSWFAPLASVGLKYYL